MKRFGLSLHLSSATLFLALALGGLHAQTPAAPKPPEDAMKRFDKDGDGLLDDAERAAAKAAMKNEPPAASGVGVTSSKPKRGDPDAMRGRMLEMFDTNKDGKLDDAERTEAKKAGAERGGAMRDELVKRFDKNGNGKLDGDEREAAASFAKRRVGEKPGASKPSAAATDAALEKAMRTTLEADAAQLQRFDDDKDGKLSDQEWQAARKAIARMLSGS
jgi:Ca2+-binding EF-hand superfamily protein